MTASNGPAEVEKRTAHCDRFRHAGSGRRQGRRRDRKLELHGILLRLGWVHEDERRAQDSASRRWQEHLPPDLSFRYLADALGFSEPPACWDWDWRALRSATCVDETVSH
jgi:hypothetical protein